MLTCGDVEQNPGPRGPRGRGRGRGRPRSDTSDEDYALRADLVAMACATFGVSPTVDAFASAANARFPVFWTAADDAFTRSWAPDTCGVLWMNPPFSRMAEVLAKVDRDGASALLVAPKWEDAAWWPTLVAASGHIILLPDEPLYLAGGSRLMPAPPWRSVVDFV